MTPPKDIQRNDRCEHHAKIEYQLTELAKTIEKQADTIDENKKDAEGKMAELKKTILQLRDDFLDSKRNPKIAIAIIGAVGVMFSTAGSVFGTLIVLYFKTTGGTP
jgi:hypothetical protein